MRTSRTVLAGSAPPSAAELHQLAHEGMAHVTGTGAEQCAHAFAFADDLSMQADLRRRVLDARALAWRLTPREAELTWLASMIVSRERVVRLFNGGGFPAQLKAARAKVGARSFEELGRLARG